MRSGDLLGTRYKVDAHLARSRRGEVWRAHDATRGDACEVEVLRVSGLEGEEALRLAAREADVAARLEGRTGLLLARGYGAAEGGQVWVARAVAPGATALPLAEGDLVERISRLAAAARAVSALHEGGVVHRDLGPHALLVAADGRVLVRGLGLARVDGVSEPLGGSPSAALLVSAPACAAPELLERLDRAAAPADVHALGALLFHALCGQWPWGTTLVEVVRRQERARAGGGPARPGAVRPEVPAALDAACAEALALEPAARLTSAAALAERLDAWLVEATALVASPPATRSPPPPPPEPPPEVPPPPDPLFVPEELRRPRAEFEGLEALPAGADGADDAGAALVLDLPPRGVEQAVVALRRLDVRGASCLLVDLGRVAHLGGAQLEALTELLTLSERRGLPIALFNVARPLRQLLRIMELEAHLPPLLAASDAALAVDELRARTTS